MLKFKSADFENWNEIGRGGFGVVYRVTHPTLKDVAVKKIPVDSVNESRIRQECQLMEKVQHPNIVKYFGYFRESGNHFIVQELCKRGSLRRYLMEEKKEPLCSAAAAHVLFQVLSAVCCCHKMNIMHRDLSAGNILISRISVTEDWKISVKICDFGLARSMTKNIPAQTYAGTPGYMPPEMRDGAGYSEAADVFALGGVLYFMLTAIDPPKGALNLARISDGDACDLIQHMRATEAKRASIDDVHKSAFMKQNLDDPCFDVRSRCSNGSTTRVSTKYSKSTSCQRLQSEPRSRSREQRLERLRNNNDEDKDQARRNSLVNIHSSGKVCDCSVGPSVEVIRQSAASSGYKSGQSNGFPPSAATGYGSARSSNNRSDSEFLWPVNTARLRGKGQLLDNSRIRVDSHGTVLREFFKKSSENTVFYVIRIRRLIKEKEQEVVFYRPRIEMKIKHLDDPDVNPRDLEIIGQPHKSFDLMNEDEKRQYRSTAMAVIQLGWNVPKRNCFAFHFLIQLFSIIVRHPVGFSWAHARLMENGDLRIIPDAHNEFRGKIIRKKKNGQVCYREYKPGGVVDMEDESIINNIEKLYRYLRDVEVVHERHYNCFPYEINLIPNSTSSPSVANQRSGTSGVISARSTSSTSAAYVLPFRLNQNSASDYRRGSERTYIYKKIKDPDVFSIQDSVSGRYLRMSTTPGFRSTVIFQQSPTDEKSQKRFDYLADVVPSEARDLVDNLKEYLQSHVPLVR